MPKRIQRKRTRGWKMPPNTVYVGRPSKWGNPFKVDKTFYKEFILTQSPINNVSIEFQFRVFHTKKEAIERSLNLYKKYLRKLFKNDFWKMGMHVELKGKNLACFCKEGEPCHADILLKLANE